MSKITREYIMNGWLKYLNTTYTEVIKTHPKELLNSPEWFNLYSVTQEQHDEWYGWAIKELCKSTRIGKKNMERLFAFTYLDVAPNTLD